MLCACSQEKQKNFYRYAVGLQLLAKEKDVKTLFYYALLHKFTPIAAKTAIAGLIIFSSVFFIKAHMLTAENRSLVKNYVNILDKSSGLKEFIESEQKKNASFDENQKELSEKINFLEAQIKKYAKEDFKDNASLDKKIQSAKREIETPCKESEF